MPSGEPACEWARLDSNQRATSYEPAALPLSYGPERSRFRPRTGPSPLEDSRPTGVVTAAVMTLRSGFSGTVGNTPHIVLPKLSAALERTIVGKAEFLNPGGSVKDRAA